MTADPSCSENDHGQDDGRNVFDGELSVQSGMARASTFGVRADDAGPCRRPTFDGGHEVEATVVRNAIVEVGSGEATAVGAKSSEPSSS